MPDHISVYDRTRSYTWNYDHPPAAGRTDLKQTFDNCHFCRLPVDSPLGISAGPLLNGRWCLYYASLGFDVLTYKTVRSRYRTCYEMPNLQPVSCGQLSGSETQLRTSKVMQGSWAVSFGMPSQDPDVWRADVEWTRSQLPTGKLLSVSVVGTTATAAASIHELADDYARCAKWAVESGADCIETNFSCPNVTTNDGQLFQQPDDAQLVAQAVRSIIGDIPYIVKIGRIPDRSAATALIHSLAPFVDSLAMTNSITATVADPHANLLFDGQPRGICGDAVRTASILQTAMFAEIIKEQDLTLRLIGVGGISKAEHVREYLAAGAEAVHLATAAMINPSVGQQIKDDLMRSATLAD